MKRRLGTMATVTAAAAIVIAGCGGPGDGKDDTAGEPSATTTTATASATPLPKGLKTPPPAPDLTSAEQAAVDQAKAAGRSGGAAVVRLESDPVSAVADRAGSKKLLATYYFPSYYDGILDTIELFANRGQRLVGKSTERWSVPVKVDLEAETPVVVLEVCTTTEGMSISGQTGDNKIKIEPTSISRTTFKADGGGKLLQTWKAEKADHVGTC